MFDIKKRKDLSGSTVRGLITELLELPIYEFTSRGGCFFCPNAGWSELQHLYNYHPDLWNYLLALQKLPNKTTERFNRVYRFDEIDEII